MCRDRHIDPPRPRPSSVGKGPASCCAQPLSFVDLETTGLDAAADRIVEICVERVQRGRVTGRLCTLVRADRWGAEEIHGIPQLQTRSAPAFEGVADRLTDLMAGTVIVAHGAAQDVAFLQSELARIGRSWDGLRVVDTLAVAREAFPGGPHGLHALCDALGIRYDRPHRAAHDVAALRALWPRLVAAAEARSIDELVAGTQRRCARRSEVLAAARSAASLGQPVRIRYRSTQRPAQWLTFCVTKVISDLDPPRVLGYLLPTRGRRELVADRVQAIELAAGEQAAEDR